MLIQHRLIIASLLLSLPMLANTYPIDAYEETGIRRLEYYRLSGLGEIEGKKLYNGAKLGRDAVYPKLIGQARALPAANPEIGAKLAKLIVQEPENYSIALLDLSDPDTPIYAEHNGDYRANVGSVGKVLVALAMLSKLHDIYPDDTAKRQSILRNTYVTADEFVIKDRHKVRFWDIDKRKIEHRPIRPGDSGNLYEFIDWALSPSSNAAAAIVQRELILLSHFGKAYPVSKAEAEAFFKQSKKAELSRIFLDAMLNPLKQSGIDTERLRQGSFFTRTGKHRVPGTSSVGNPRELVKLLYLIETGQLIDAFTSTELKRLLYLTERRIRYASHPNLHPFALYFKTGSLYSCQPEEGFKCGKYKGNRVNRLASVAIIEAPEGEQYYHYMVVVQSNVLRVNSAVAHQTLAARIHKLVRSLHQSE